MTNRRINLESNPYYVGHCLNAENNFWKISEQNTNYPPFNVIYDKDSELTFIEMAVAGFSKEDLSVSHDKKKNLLVVTGKSKPESPDEQKDFVYRHRGISSKSFERKYETHPHGRVKNVSLEDGILTITMYLDVPEDEKPEVFDIS